MSDIAVDLFREVFPDTFEGTKIKVQVFKTGKFVHPESGDIEITPDGLRQAKENFEKTDRALVVDFDHGTDWGGSPADRVAAGWIRDLEIEESDGAASMYAVFDATDEAAQWVKDGKYRFFSPTFNTNYVSKTTGQPQGFTLLRGALTNSPFLDGMHPAVAMSERAAEAMKKDTEKKDEKAGQETEAGTKSGTKSEIARTVLVNANERAVRLGRAEE